jgi:hypothetical protein
VVDLVIKLRTHHLKHISSKQNYLPLGKLLSPRKPNRTKLKISPRNPSLKRFQTILALKANDHQINNKIKVISNTAMISFLCFK